MIQFNCPACNKLYQVPDSAAGRQAKCSKCGQRIAVPSPEDAPLIFLDEPSAVAEQRPTARSVIVVASPLPPTKEQVKRCPYCREEVLASATKCRHCHESLGGNVVAQPAASQIDPKTRTRSFVCPSGRFHDVILSVRGWLLSNDFKCQTVPIDDGSIVIQVEKSGDWRKLVGMSTALNVCFSQNGDNLTVGINAGRWLDKAAVGAIGMFVILWPLAVTAGIGAWEQVKLPERVFGHVESLLGGAAMHTLPTIDRPVTTPRTTDGQGRPSDPTGWLNGLR